jgi:hypothetical protein
LSAHVKDDAAAPLVRYDRSGDTKTLSYVLFDDFVLPEETALRLELHDWELDYDLRYGVTETIQTPYYDDMGGGSLLVSTLAPGTYSFANSDWSCAIEVRVFDYPFQSLVGVGDPAPPPERSALQVFPQPARAGVRIVTAPWGGASRLEILDLSGRLVRRIEGAGASFTWDGRAADGRPAPAGVYLARVTAGTEVRSGRICLLR